MPFGKHKGKEIHTLPRNYLTWCLKTLDKISPDLRKAMEFGTNGKEWNPPITDINDICEGF